jgi:hypothetical protein
MRKSIFCGACLLVAVGTANPAVATEATPAGATACEAKQYGTLVGKAREEARWVRGDYRLLPAGRAPGIAKPGRVTIIYDPNSNRITDVTCG